MKRIPRHNGFPRCQIDESPGCRACLSPATFVSESLPSSPALRFSPVPQDRMKTFLSQSFAPLRRFCLILIVAGVVAAAFGALAQEEENRRLDGVKATLDQIEQELSAGTLDDAVLTDIQRRVQEARAGAASVTEALAPRAQSIQTRLDQLGQPPAEGQPPESPELTQERQAQIDARKPIDEVLKRASALAVQADQLTDTAAQKRRDLFAVKVLARSRSLLDPGLWGSVIDEVPRRLVATTNLLRGWGGLVADGIHERRGLVLAGALILAVIIVWPVRKWIQRLGQLYFAETTPPTRLRRSLGAVWTVFTTTIAPLAAALVVYSALTRLGFVPARAVPFLEALLRLTGFAAFVTGLSRAVLSPQKPSWRLPDLSDEAARRLAPYPIWIVAVASVAHALLAFFDVIGIGLAPVMVTDGVASVLIAVIFGLALRPAKAAAEVEPDGAPAPHEEVWFHSLIRLAAWAAIAVIIAAALIGYISFSFFIANQMIWIGIVSAVLYILLTLTDDLVCGWWPASRIGQLTHGTVGLRKSSLDQLCAIISGVLRLILIALAVLLIVAPWGLQSVDVTGWIRRAFGGVALGGFSVSLSTVLAALTVLVVGVVLTRGVQRWLDKTYLPRTRLDEGLKNSIRTATGYAGVLLAIGLAFSSLGVGLDRIALVAGALSVGIGFGLQAVVSNFVSGLILLAERPIKVGDWVGVGAEEGNVRRISVRATVIELFDHSTLIVPNSDLITKPVRNWTHFNSLGIVQLQIGTGHEADIAEVRSLLLEATAALPVIVNRPPPEVLIIGTTDLGVQWKLRCSVPSPRQVAGARSELYFAVLKEFQAKKIRITASPAV